MNFRTRIFCVVYLFALFGQNSVFSAGSASSVKITILSTMLAEYGNEFDLIGEWGFAALVEVGDEQILFDTGARPDTVLKNAKILGIDLSKVTNVVLSHHHSDHTGGLISLRDELRKQNPTAVSRVHVARGMFANRRDSDTDVEVNTMIQLRKVFEASGGEFIVHDKPVELVKGVWLTGPVPRVHPERNWSGRRRIVDASILVEDTILEDLSLVIDTPKVLVIVSGCGHSGIVNTLDYAQRAVRKTNIYAAVGGFHLFGADDERLAWTAAELKGFELSHLLGAHCTGIEAVFRIRELAGLGRETAVVAAVGASFSLNSGIDPLDLAR